MRRSLTSTLAGGLLAIGVSSTAPAQDLNMDMSWAIQSQQQNWDWGMYNAQAAAQNWYNMVQDYRAQTGYTGFIGSGITPMDLMRSNASLQQTYDSYNAQWANLSDRHSGITDNYISGAIYGQSTWTDPNGQTWLIDNSMSNLYMDGSGQVYYGGQTPSGMTSINTSTMGRVW